MYLFEVGLGAAATVALLSAIAAYWLLARALWPRCVDDAERRFAATPTRCIASGAGLLLIGLVVISKLLSADGASRALGVVTASLLLGATLAGAAGVAARVGSALPSPSDASRPWMPTLRGGVVVLVACLVPVLGWFVLLPALLAGGLGAALLGRLRPIGAPATRVVDVAPSTSPAGPA